MGSGLFEKWGCPFPSFYLHSLSSLSGAPYSNPVREFGERRELPSGFMRSTIAKRFMVHFELKIMPLVTQNQQQTTYLCHS